MAATTRANDRPTAGVVGTGFVAAEVRAATTLPGGHAEGFAETFRELYRTVYRAVAAGGPPPEPDYPTFADGHWEHVLGEAIARSSRERAWVEARA